MKTHPLSILLCLSLTLLTLSLAQQKPSKPSRTPPPSEGKKKDEAPAENQAASLRQRALGLLRSAGEEAAGLDDRLASARIQAAAADALWEHDQDRARKLFQSSFETAILYYREGSHNSATPEIFSTFIGTHICSEIIGLAARRDPAFGLELGEKYVEEQRRKQQAPHSLSAPGGRSFDLPLSPPGMSLDELSGTVNSAANELLQTASNLLKDDPKKAIEVAQYAFSKMVPRQAGQFLAQLAGSDRKAADQLFLVALERLRTDINVVPGQLILLSTYPFGVSGYLVTDGRRTTWGDIQVPEGFVIDELLIQQFIGVAFAVLSRTAELDAAQTPDAASRLGAALYATRVLESRVAQYYSGLLPQWQELAAKLSTRATEGARQGIDRSIQEIEKESQSAAAPETPGQGKEPPARAKDAAKETAERAKDHLKTLLDHAEKTLNLTERDGLYQEAAFFAFEQLGDIAQALEIADRIADYNFRQEVRSWLSFDGASRALGEQRFDEAWRLALEVQAPDQRAFLMTEVASAVLKEKGRKRATELLDEAVQRTNPVDNTAEKLRALTCIARLFAGFDSSRGFEVMAEAARTANKVSDYSPGQSQLRRVFRQRGSGFMMSQTVEGFNLESTLAVLARTDFDRALLLAQSLDHKPLKLASLIAVATSVFDQWPAAKIQ